MRVIQCISEAELMLSILMQLGDFESPLVISKFLIFSEKNKLGSELLRGVVPPNGKGGSFALSLTVCKWRFQPHRLIP